MIEWKHYKGKRKVETREYILISNSSNAFKYRYFLKFSLTRMMMKMYSNKFEQIETIVVD